jgi:hypothetical protein
MEVSREEVRKIIDFLRENPDMAREFGVVIHPVLDERLDSFERAMEKHFAEASSRFLALDEKFDALIKEMHEGFEAVNKRLETQDLRLKEHDEKFDALIKEMHEGFEAVNKRLETQDLRLKEHDEKFDALIKEMHEGFEAVNKRLETQDLRLGVHDRKFDSLIKEMHDGFEAANKKFAEHDRKFDSLIKEMHDGFEAANKKFAEHDRKFDSLIKEMHDGFEAANKKFAEHDRKFDSLIKEMHDGFAIASRERGSLGNTLGKLIENRVTDRVEDFAERRGWKISLRTVNDSEEVDLMVRNGLKFFVETKSHADRDALEQTLRKARKLKIPGILVGERIDRGVLKEAKVKKLLCLNLREFRNALESGKIERFLSK